MKKTLIIGAILTATIMIPGLALATSITEVSGIGNCDAWSASATVNWGSGVFAGDLDYSIVLFDASGAEVTRSEWAGTITRDTSSVVSYMYSGLWNMDLCGEFTVVATFHLVAPLEGNPDEESTMEFTAAFTCICDEPEEPGDCYLTPGFWKNHLTVWPQDTLTLGGIEMSQADLVAILKSPARGDATVILARHLIAAKLNVANGADTSIQPVIDEGDDYLSMHAVYSRPGKDEGRKDALEIKGLLVNYNEQGCPEADDDADANDSEKLFDDGSEANSWGNLKAAYK